MSSCVCVRVCLCVLSEWEELFMIVQREIVCVCVCVLYISCPAGGTEREVRTNQNSFNT